jgi:hypothetical protein
MTNPTPSNPFPADPVEYFRQGQALCAARTELQAPLLRIANRDGWMMAIRDDATTNPVANRDLVPIAEAALKSPPMELIDLIVALHAPEPMPPRMQIAWCVLDGWFAGA